ncbi:SH3 domain-containing protein [Ensifer canadensis]
MRLVLTAFVSLVMSVVFSVALAQDIRTETIRFLRGASSASIKGSITGRESVRYVIDVKRGQRVSIQLDTSNRSNYFNVIAPGADSALFNGSVSGGSTSFVAEVSGKHVIDVYLMRNAARRNELARYTLTVSAEATGQAAATPPDFADGLAGGPDTWRVSEVPAGDVLNLRAAPSARDRILDTARDGEILRNRGCAINGGTRWCQVENRRGVKGWVAGRYLREADGSW